MSINESVALDEMIGGTTGSGSFRYENELTIEAELVP